MKKIFTILSVVAIGTFANAQTQVLNEPFSFTGLLETNNNGWFRHGGTAGQLSVSGGVVQLSSSNNEDSNKNFTPYATNTANTVYKAEYLVDVGVRNTTNMLAAGDYFMCFGTSTTAADGNNAGSFIARLFVKPVSTDANKFQLGIATNTSTPTALIPTEFSVLDTQNPVYTTAKVTYEITKDASNAVYLQKTTLTIGSESVSDNAVTSPPTQLANVVIRESGSATNVNNTGNVNIDNIIVNTYASFLAVTDINKSKDLLITNTIIDNTLDFRATKSASIKMFSIDGKLVKSANITSSNGRVDVSALAKGVYFVTAEINGETFSQKVIKK